MMIRRSSGSADSGLHIPSKTAHKSLSSERYREVETCSTTSIAKEKEDIINEIKEINGDEPNSKLKPILDGIKKVINYAINNNHNESSRIKLSDVAKIFSEQIKLEKLDLQENKILILEFFKVVIEFNIFPDIDLSNPVNGLIKLGFDRTSVDQMLKGTFSKRTLTTINKINHYYIDVRKEITKETPLFIVSKINTPDTLAKIHNSDIQQYLNKHQLKDYTTKPRMEKVMPLIKHLDKNIGDFEEGVELSNLNDQIGMLFHKAEEINDDHDIVIAVLYLFQVLATHGILPTFPMTKLEDLAKVGIPDVIVKRLQNNAQLSGFFGGDSPNVLDLINKLIKNSDAYIHNSSSKSDFPLFPKKTCSVEVKLFELRPKQKPAIPNHPLTEVLNQKSEAKGWEGEQKKRYDKLDKYIRLKDLDKVIDPVDKELKKITDEEKLKRQPGYGKFLCDKILDDSSNIEKLPITNINDYVSKYAITAEEAQLIVLKIIRLRIKNNDLLKFEYNSSTPTDKLKDLGFDDNVIAKLNLSSSKEFLVQLNSSLDLLSALYISFSFESVFIPKDSTSINNPGKNILIEESKKHIDSKISKKRSKVSNFSKYHNEISHNISQLNFDKIASSDLIVKKILSLFNQNGQDLSNLLSVDEREIIGLKLIVRMLELNIFPQFTSGFKKEFLIKMGIPKTIYDQIIVGDSLSFVNKICEFYNESHATSSAPVSTASSLGVEYITSSSSITSKDGSVPITPRESLSRREPGFEVTALGHAGKSSPSLSVSRGNSTFTADINGIPHTYESRDVKADGNCLYASIIKGLDINITDSEEDLKNKVINLRHDVANSMKNEYTLANKADKLDLDIWAKKQIKDSGNPKVYFSDYNDYISSVEKLGFWGCEKEFKHLVKICKRPIYIMTPDGRGGLMFRQAFIHNDDSDEVNEILPENKDLNEYSEDAIYLRYHNSTHPTFGYGHSFTVPATGRAEQNNFNHYDLLIQKSKTSRVEAERLGEGPVVRPLTAQNLQELDRQDESETLRAPGTRVETSSRKKESDDSSEVGDDVSEAPFRDRGSSIDTIVIDDPGILVRSLSSVSSASSFTTASGTENSDYAFYNPWTWSTWNPVTLVVKALPSPENFNEENIDKPTILG